LVLELPETARRISGKTIALADNGMGWETLSLTFADDEGVARMTVDGSPPIQIGLDGAYRAADLPPQVVGPTPNTRIMGRGTWTTGSRFACDFQIMGSPEDPMQVIMDFEGDTIHVRAVGIQPQVIELTGTLQE
jgi:hypothetical protein